MSLSAEERSLRGRAGAYAQHAKHDVHETTAAARDAWLKSFEDAVDPEGTLPPAERHRRAIAARKSHMAVLALKSAKARRRD
jgi:truncated hemoglobin YjbI